MFCGNCYTMCPALPLANAEGDGIALWVGGKVSNVKSAPMFSKLAVPYIPNEPPRWPTTVNTIKKIVGGTQKHKSKLTLTDAEIASVAGYMSSGK